MLLQSCATCKRGALVVWSVRADWGAGCAWGKVLDAGKFVNGALCFGRSRILRQRGPFGVIGWVCHLYRWLSGTQGQQDPLFVEKY